MKYIKLLFEHFFFRIKALTCFTSLMFRECTFQVNIALFEVLKVLVYCIYEINGLE